MNICVLVDNSWDNVPILMRRLKKLSPDCKIHTIYSMKLKNIEISSRNCNIQVLRHSAKTVSETISNILSFCDLCFLFHNFIEYNTPTSVTLELCKEHSIPCFIFPEYTKEYYFNDSLSTFSLSKNLKTVTRKERLPISLSNELLNDTTVVKILPSMDEARESLKNSYEQNKKTREIVTLYDKDAHREEKMKSKIEKAARHLQYSTDRINFYKK